MYTPRKEIPNLKTRREAKDYSEFDLAKISGVGVTTIRRAEAGGKVSSDSYKWIEEALNEND